MTVFISNKKNLGAAVMEYKKKARQKMGYYKHLLGQARRDNSWPWKCTSCSKRMGQRQFEIQTSYQLKPTCNWCDIRSKKEKENKYVVDIVLK